MTQHVTDFLIEFKDLVRNKRFWMIPRPINNETILKLEFTKRNVEDTLLSLTTNHFVQGPLQDRDRPDTGPLHVFRTKIDGQEIYIKLKIDVSKTGVKMAKCISFHETK